MVQGAPIDSRSILHITIVEDEYEGITKYRGLVHYLDVEVITKPVSVKIAALGDAYNKAERLMLDYMAALREDEDEEANDYL